MKVHILKNHKMQRTSKRDIQNTESLSQVCSCNNTGQRGSEKNSRNISEGAGGASDAGGCDPLSRDTRVEDGGRFVPGHS